MRTIEQRWGQFILVAPNGQSILHRGTEAECISRDQEITREESDFAARLKNRVTGIVHKMQFTPEMKASIMADQSAGWRD